MSKGKSNREIGVHSRHQCHYAEKHVNKLYASSMLQNRADAVRRGLASSVPEDDVIPAKDRHPPLIGLRAVGIHGSTC